MKPAVILAVLGIMALAVWWIAGSDDARRQILISEAVAAPLPGGGAAVFLKVENQGFPDRLIGVEGSGAVIYAEEGQAPIPTGTASLALDGVHIRLPDRPADGALIPLTLVFDNAGHVAVKARHAEPVAQGDAPSYGLFGYGGICIVGDGEPAPELAMTVSPDGDGWQVRIETEQFTFTEDLLGGDHIPGTGHAHLYVGGMKLGRMFSADALIGALPPGQHEVRVTLNTNDHRAYVVGATPVTATAVITVD